MLHYKSGWVGDQAKNMDLRMNKLVTKWLWSTE